MNLDVKILVVLAKLDGKLIEYSFDVSDENVKTLREKYNVDDSVEDESNNFKITTLKELLDNDFKSETDDYFKC